jgi:hypothetical protein
MRTEDVDKAQLLRLVGLSQARHKGLVAATITIISRLEIITMSIMAEHDQHDPLLVEFAMSCTQVQKLLAEQRQRLLLDGRPG